jgi:histidinol phosphatase-like enzyme
VAQLVSRNAGFVCHGSRSGGRKVEQYFMKTVAFLHRDGVINRKAPEGQYVRRWEEMDFLPETCEAIGLLNDAGFLVVIVSNQRCVAEGHITTGEQSSQIDSGAKEC